MTDDTLSTDTISPRREWRSVDKSEWGNGEWQREPDKVQWVDAATNLDCLIVRGPSGSLCGYVGVPEPHPLFGVGYSSCPRGCADFCDHRLDSRFQVHGGLTFSDVCHEPTREAWDRWRSRLPALRAEAEKFPHGSAAEQLRAVGHLANDFDAWRARGESQFICHVPQPGRPARVWWFGFDCAHYGDFSPKFDSTYGWRADSEYRDIRYVEGECADLARQLAEASSVAA